MVNNWRRTLRKILPCIHNYRHALACYRRQFRPDALEAVTTARLLRLLRHAINNVAHYRAHYHRLDVGAGALREQTARDLLQHFPVLDKPTVQSAFWSLICGQELHCKIQKTSGSTGVPLTVLHDVGFKVFNSAATLRAQLNCGMSLWGERVLHCSYIDRPEPVLRQRWTWWQGVNRMAVCAVPGIQSRHTELLTAIKRFNPTVLSGNPYVVAMFVRKMHDAGIPIRPHLIITVDASISDKDRATLLHVCPDALIAESYGMYEVGEVAQGCTARCGMHVNVETVLVEVLDDNGDPVPDGQEGRIVVTNLVNSTMPIIRYNTGDIGMMDHSQCPCGSHLPRITGLSGRVSDYIRLPSGRTIAPIHFYIGVDRQGSAGLMLQDCFAKYQIIQETTDLVRVRYVRGTQYRSAMIERVHQELNELFEHTVRVVMEEVDDIQPGPSGKYRFVRSNLC